MKLVSWKFEGLEVPMIDIDGDLYCTSKAICGALGIVKHNLTMCHKRHSDEIGEPLGSQNVTLRNFVKDNKAFFSIVRLKGDLSFWSEDQMLTFAFHIKGDKAVQFRKNLITMVKQYAKRDMVTLEEYNELEARNEFLEHQVEAMANTIEAVQTPMGKIATETGKLLRMQRDVKAFRTTKPIGAA